MKIAHISFGYDNAALLNLLLQRGALLTKGKYDKITKIDKKIDDLITEEDEKLQRPVNAFITFETQAGLDRALSWFPNDKKTKSKLLDLINPEQFDQ